MPLTSRLFIETVCRSGKTILKSSFAGHPFKLADITEDIRQHNLKLMLRNSSPGILDDDEYLCEIVVGENSSLRLQTQSYQRLFTMRKGATQDVKIHLQEGASFTYLPHPLVPHKNASFVSRNNIYLKAGCELIWGEVISCGRKENGEVFLFSLYHNVTQIFLNDRLVVKENILFKPDEMDLASMGLLEGYTHQASLIFLNEKVNMQELITLLVEDLNEEENIIFGVSKLWINGLVVRMIGFKAEQLYNLLQEISKRLRNMTRLNSLNQAHVS